MSKANEDIKYDPELPYVVLDFGGRVIVRFADKHIAEFFANNHVNYKTVIDTTPKPKIPESAQHITWGDEKVAYSLMNGLWYGWTHGYGLSERELLGWIGAAEVTVLVRKEES